MLKKIHKFYKNNRIYCILMIISIFCVLLMGISIIIYFVNQNNSSPYGSRGEGIENYPLGDTLKDLETFFEEKEEVKKVISVHLQEPKTIKIEVEVDKDMKNEEIQNIATSSLENISEENRSFYDVQFIFERESLNPYFGSKTSSNTNISWTKYSYDTEEETTTTTKKK